MPVVRSVPTTAGVDMKVRTISRQYGAGGSERAKRLGARRGFRVIDTELVTLAAERSGQDHAKIARVYSPRPTFQGRRVYKERSEKYPAAVNDVVETGAQAGPAISAGRGANLVLRHHPNVGHRHRVADFAGRLAHVQRREGRDEPAARRTITESAYARAAYYRYRYNGPPAAPLTYDLVRNPSRGTLVEAAALSISAFAARRRGRQQEDHHE